jgi:KEOPS complex subunit Pcc1
MIEAAATIGIELPSEEQAKIVMRALRPEAESSPTRRSEVEIGLDGRKILLHFKAEDTTALRASVNSYTRWVKLIQDTLSKAESF